MPKEMSETLETILPACRRRETLDLYLNNGTILRLSKGEVIREIDETPVTYSNQIREVSELRQSIESSIDRITITLENISSDLGFNLSSDLRLLDFAFAVYGRQYVSIRNGTIIEDIPEIFRGIVANVEADEQRFQIEKIVDYDSLGPILASRSLSPRCPFTYKNGIECTSESSETDCSKTRAACKLRGKEYEFGGTEFFEEPTATPPPGDGGGIGTGDGGGYDPGSGGTNGKEYYLGLSY